MPRPPYDLEERLLAFAVKVCRLADGFPTSAVGRHARWQLVRSATSPAANYGEVQAAESRRDFVHKLTICLKELRETAVWLTFAGRMDLQSADQIAGV